MKAWAIKKWNETFEAAATRKLRKLDYVGIPVDQGSLRFRTLMATTAGAAAFGHFIAIVEWAATLPCRGLLVRSGRPLSIEEVARLVALPVRALKISWAILSDPDLGWLEEVEVEGDGKALGYVWTGVSAPAIRHQSPNDPPPIRQSPTGTPLALNTPTHPPNTTPPPTTRRGGSLADQGGDGGDGGEAISDSDQDRSLKALRHRPWPDVTPTKAKGLASLHRPAAILAAIKRGRAQREREGDRYTTGMLVKSIESGDGEALAREAARAWWDRAQVSERAKAGAAWARTRPDEPIDEATSDAFADFIADVLAKPKPSQVP